MIFVDTSVWVAALRSGRSPEASHLRSLLDSEEVGLAAPVRIEILSGASRRDRPRLRRVLSALPTYYPDARTWRAIDDWVERAGEAGERFGFTDLLIGALAAGESAFIWSLDDDFARMSRLSLVQRYEPR